MTASSIQLKEFSAALASEAVVYQAKIGVDTIERLLSAAGFTLGMELVPRLPADPVVEAFRKDIDRSLLLRNLEKSPDERVRSLQALARFADEAQRAGRAAARKTK